MVLPLKNAVFSRKDAKQFFHAPTEDEVSSTLKQTTLE
jgi:hypothetical protein